MVDVVRALLILAFIWSAPARAQQYDPRDEAIRCYSSESCNQLIGKRLWVSINNNQICDSLKPGKCRTVRPGYGFVVQAVVGGSDPADRYFSVLGDDGQAGFRPRNSKTGQPSVPLSRLTPVPRGRAWPTTLCVLAGLGLRRSWFRSRSG